MGQGKWLFVYLNPISVVTHGSKNIGSRTIKVCIVLFICLFVYLFVIVYLFIYLFIQCVCNVIFKSFSTPVTMIVDIDLSPISRLITSIVGLFLAPLALTMSSPSFFSQGFEINWNTRVREHLPSTCNLPRRFRLFRAPLLSAYLVSSTIPKENGGLSLLLVLLVLL